MQVQNSSKFSAPFFNNLNGLRFFGALAVFFFHAFTLGREGWSDFFTSDGFQMIAKVMSKGHHGVGLFFVLSGFLITYLLLNEAKEKGKINAGGFFMRRLLRIWPLYFIVVLFGFFLFPLLPTGSHTTNSLLHYSLFLSNFEEIWNGWRDAISFLTVTWSVSIEEQFYMAWVLLIAVLPAFRRGKHFQYFLFAALVGSLVFRTMYVTDERMLYYHTFSVMSDLAIGGSMSFFAFHYKVPEKLKELKRWWIVLIYVVGTAVIVGSTKLFPGYLHVIERLVIGLFFAFIIFEQVYCSHSFFKADKLLGFFTLGEMSYGFYMYHCIVIYFVQQYFWQQNWNDFPAFFMFICSSLIITAMISWLSYRFIERPFLRLKKYFR